MFLNPQRCWLYNTVDILMLNATDLYILTWLILKSSSALKKRGERRKTRIVPTEESGGDSAK